jgi:hypothetical protein
MRRVGSPIKLGPDAAVRVREKIGGERDCIVALHNYYDI